MKLYIYLNDESCNKKDGFCKWKWWILYLKWWTLYLKWWISEGYPRALVHHVLLRPRRALQGQRRPGHLCAPRKTPNSRNPSTMWLTGTDRSRSLSLSLTRVGTVQVRRAARWWISSSRRWRGKPYKRMTFRVTNDGVCAKMMDFSLKMMNWMFKMLKMITIRYPIEKWWFPIEQSWFPVQKWWVYIKMSREQKLTSRCAISSF